MRKLLLHRRLVVALFAALLCILSPFSVPFGNVPLSLATFGVYLCALLLGGRGATATVLIYLALGAMGVPVFAGFNGGVQAFAGVTGGFLCGELLCACIAGTLCRRLPSHPLLQGVYLLAGTLALYICGTAWLAVCNHIPWHAAWLIGCVPFLPFDIVKIVAAVTLSATLKKAIKKRS